MLWCDPHMLAFIMHNFSMAPEENWNKFYNRTVCTICFCLSHVSPSQRMNRSNGRFFIYSPPVSSLYENCSSFYFVLQIIILFPPLLHWNGKHHVVVWEKRGRTEMGE